MLLIVGASASGKTEIAKLLVKHHGFTKCVTTTTRPIRPGEVDTVDYYFLSKEAFLDLINNDTLVEYNIYQDNYYGLQKKDVKKDSLVILEPNGANNLIKLYDKDILVVLLKTSKDERVKRMKFRGDNDDSIKRRIQSDDELFDESKLLRVDHIIVNEKEALLEHAKVISDYYTKFKKSLKWKNTMQLL